jgi:pyruvate/2-oxoglutarate dehydrogenase complex dihydrolipoamide acyltransferase (E2) component
MTDIRLDGDLWATTMAPEGWLERWRVDDGAAVTAGDPLAEVRIEDALHTIVAPVSGRLRRLAAENDVVEPGTAIASLD